MGSRDELREQVNKLRQDIRDMFKLEGQRNDINYALTGVERGEMTIQDYEDDLSLAIANYVIQDIVPGYVTASNRALLERLLGQLKVGSIEINPGWTGTGYVVPLSVIERELARLERPEGGE